MRFIENGPAIPNELLNARDAGQVVFFCGAGVSQARAKLPDFFGLAEAVLQDLHAPENSDARKVLNKARDLGKELSVTGLISADRIFGLLERDFTARDIQAAVARSLVSKMEPDLSAHQILLRLATTPMSRTQLVTTNFDRLFEKSNGTLQHHQYPRLPILSRDEVIDGVVYLHGRVNDDYTGADGAGLILSSSDFGHAYLSEGRATEFFREIVRGYVVVFIGYSADDPPIHYLLEGLRKAQDPCRQIFAFQCDESDEAIARWRHKGVDAISYSQANGHCALWETLEKWAHRADDPNSWRRTVLDLAMAGPEKLQPHQRGQVAHIVSTDEGTREFAELAPPAEWLCVFDPSCRYSRIEQSYGLDPENPIVDPFSLYGLDFDSPPQRDDPNKQSTNPQSVAWDAFVSSALDRQDLTDDNFAAMRGHYAVTIPRLPKRLDWLGLWLAKVANQATTVWWVARQTALHQGILRQIEWGLEHRHGQMNPVIRTAWHYLLLALKPVYPAWFCPDSARR